MRMRCHGIGRSSAVTLEGRIALLAVVVGPWQRLSVSVSLTVRGPVSPPSSPVLALLYACRRGTARRMCRPETIHTHPSISVMDLVVRAGIQ
jgi:hypothetical protein